MQKELAGTAQTEAFDANVSLFLTICSIPACNTSQTYENEPTFLIHSAAHVSRVLHLTVLYTSE